MACSRALSPRSRGPATKRLAKWTRHREATGGQRVVQGPHRVVPGDVTKTLLAEVVLEAMVVCLMRIGEALPTKLITKKLTRDDIKFVYKNGKLYEVIIRIYPLKQSVRARKAGHKLPIAILANAGPYLMAAELLWQCRIQPLAGLTRVY